MHLTRRHFMGAAVAASAALSTAACVITPRITGRQFPAVPPPPPPPSRGKFGSDSRSPLVDEALAALFAQGDRILHRDRIGIADFALASREPRFHIVDVETRQIKTSFLVAHGSGSDPGHTGLLQRFSNAPGSNATSRGAYLSAETYVGKYGRSQRLIGLDPHNDMALDRAIVVHGAPYVAPELIASQGRIGRSQGCFAFELGEVATVMDLLGEGRMIYAGKSA